MPKARLLLFAGIAIVAILVGFLSAQFMGVGASTPVTLSTGTMLPEPRALPDFQLLSSTGQPYEREQLLQHWSLVFFGYTSCPDICPTTLTTLAQVEKQLATLPANQRPQMVFISVDPQRDTPIVVGNYVKFFSTDFIGLTGEQPQIEQLTHAMGAPVSIQQTGNGTYTVDHAATLFLLDPQARMTAIFSPPHTLAALATDLRAIITQSSK
jgi:protein SCO1